MDSRIAVYTAVIGSYDSLNQPFEPAEGFDFICFVPKGMKTQERIGSWRIEELPVSWPDNTLTARFPKLNPQTVLEGYDWSLWIDGNVAIADASVYSICRELQAGNVRYAGIRHPYRDCTYDEAVSILKNGREKLCVVLRAVRFLRKNAFPAHAGLQETNVLFRKHNDAAVLEFDRWWWECLLRYAAGHRDQLMHSFCLSDTRSLDWTSFLPDGRSTRDYPGFEYMKHGKTVDTAACRRWPLRKSIYLGRNLKVFVLKLYLRLFVK